MEKDNKHIPYIKSDDLVMLFDGACKLCNAWSRFIIRYDNKVMIKLVSMQSEKGQEILESLGKPKKHFETILFVEKNRTYEKSSAFFKIIHHLPFPIKILIVFQYIPRIVTDFIYNQIAKNRYKLFGKYKQCTLPESKQKNRFL